MKRTKSNDAVVGLNANPSIDYGGYQKVYSTALLQSKTIQNERGRDGMIKGASTEFSKMDTSATSPKTRRKIRWGTLVSKIAKWPSIPGFRRKEVVDVDDYIETSHLPPDIDTIGPMTSIFSDGNVKTPASFYSFKSITSDLVPLTFEEIRQLATRFHRDPCPSRPRSRSLTSFAYVNQALPVESVTLPRIVPSRLESKPTSFVETPSNKSESSLQMPLRNTRPTSLISRLNDSSDTSTPLTIDTGLETGSATDPSLSSKSNSPAKSTIYTSTPMSRITKRLFKKKSIFSSDRPSPESIVGSIEQFFPKIDDYRLVELQYRESVHSGKSSLPKSHKSSPTALLLINHLSTDSPKDHSVNLSTMAKKGLNANAARRGSISSSILFDPSPSKSKDKESPQSIFEMAEHAYLKDYLNGADEASFTAFQINSLKRPSQPSFSPHGIQFKPEDSGGKKIVWYRGDLIGRGAYGSVFLGLDLENWRLMAVKQVLNLNRRGSNSRRKSSVLKHPMILALTHEISLLKQLQHRHIVEYYGFEQTPTENNIFLEYVAGGSIASVLAKTGPFPEDLILVLCFQILSGLEYLHSQSVIHRDIKGANILLDHHGMAKISDFGISLKVDGPLRKTSDVAVKGTANWMAPEIVRSKGYGAKVDVWSFGCVVIEMLTGCKPWKHLSLELQIFSQLLRGQAPEIPTRASLELSEFTKMALTSQPDQRASVRELSSHAIFERVRPYDYPYTDFVQKASAKWKVAQMTIEESDDSNSDDEEMEEQEYHSD